MGAKRSWWKQIKTHRVTTILISLSFAVFVLVLIGGYKFNWAWTGFNGTDKTDKTLYDWMQLLFIPVVLAIAGFWFNYRERKAAELRAENEREAAELRAKEDREIEEKRNKHAQKLALDSQREDRLQTYLDRMSELLLTWNLRKSEINAEVRYMARARTLTLLTQLNEDDARKGAVLQFLYEAHLISQNVDGSIVNLEGANLSDGDYTFLNLHNANLHKAIMINANFESTDLSGTDLVGADLDESRLWYSNVSGSDLKGASLQYAVLKEANLQGADLSKANLMSADLSDANLSGAILIGADLGYFINSDHTFRARAAKLTNANLSNAIFTDANLAEVDFTGANLSGAILNGANLTGAVITKEQLDKAKSLKGATMPGSIHP